MRENKWNIRIETIVSAPSNPTAVGCVAVGTDQKALADIYDLTQMARGIKVVAFRSNG